MPLPRINTTARRANVIRHFWFWKPRGGASGAISEPYFKFDGSYVRVCDASTDTIKIGTAWRVRWSMRYDENTGAVQYPWAFVNSSTSRITASITTGNFLRVAVSDGTNWVTGRSFLMTVGQTYRADARYDGTTLRLFINGVEATDSSNGASGGSVGGVIGCATTLNTTNSFRGVIQDFQVDGPTGNPVHYWPINQPVPDGGIVPDIIGGCDGTLTQGSGEWVPPLRRQNFGQYVFTARPQNR